MEELIQIAKKLKQLELCGELRIVYREHIGAKAIAMTNTDKFVIVVDPSLCYEQQVKEVWHEAKHICSHLNTNCSVYEAEREAECFADKAVKHPEVIEMLRMVNNL